MVKKKFKTNLSPQDLANKYSHGGLGESFLQEWEDLLFIPTSSPVMNYYLGGGFAYGRIAEIAGHESSGKSLLAMDAVKNAQELGGVGIYIDSELAFDRSWAEMNGLDMSKLFVYKEDTMENLKDFTAEACIAYRSELVDNEPIVLVFDSVAAVDSAEVKYRAAVSEKAEMGSRAKAWGNLLRWRNSLWHRLGITVICVNQLRSKINTGFGAQFEDSDTTPGGKALPFYASQRLYLEQKKQLTIGSKDKRRRIGAEVNVKVKKNKIAPPKAPGRVPVIFHPDGGDLGFDKWAGLEDILIKENVLERSGTQYSFDGKVIATSRSGILDAIQEDEDLFEDIMFEAKIITTEQAQDRIDSKDDNLFPVSIVEFSGSEDEED
jgi:recombination protein RecA